MSALQTVAMGLVLVFVDVGSSGWDWVADPLGWVLVLIGLAALKEIVPNHRGLTATAWVCLAVAVLTYTPDSVATLDESLGWLFSLPTIVFSFLVCDAVMEVTEDSLARSFDVLRYVFVVVGLLPALIYFVGWDWLTIPTAVVAVLANVVLVVTLWSAGDDEDAKKKTGFDADRVRKNPKSDK